MISGLKKLLTLYLSTNNKDIVQFLSYLGTLQTYHHAEIFCFTWVFFEGSGLWCLKIFLHLLLFARPAIIWPIKASAPISWLSEFFKPRYGILKPCPYL